MASPPPPPAPPRGALSLYDNIQDPNDPDTASTISAAPILYDQGASSAAAAAAKKPLDAALRFQPLIRRPPPKQTKPKAGFPKPMPTPASAPAAAAVPSSAPPKTTLADWTATEEDEWLYGTGEKPQRGGRKKKKKQQQQLPVETNWDDFYDPNKPTNVEEYLRSDEKINEVLEWKALLYRHRRKRRSTSHFSSDRDETRGELPRNQFAPPPAHAFAPPPPSPPAPRPEEETAGEAAMAGRAEPSPDQALPPSAPTSNPEPPLAAPGQDTSPPPPPPSDAVTISRAPVLYKPPPAEDEEVDDAGPLLDPSGADAAAEGPQRSRRPGQSGFAHRLMSKYGWTEGTGLGADESGIVKPLRAQVEKRRKKADAEGGGWAEPGGKGRILGGKRKQEAGRFGKMSEVIVLENMLDNMANLEDEIAQGLGQEIGEECGEKYGRVERLHIAQEARLVFIKFTDQVSALRAVNELDGRLFNGNTIAPRFYDAEKFDGGVYGASV